MISRPGLVVLLAAPSRRNFHSPLVLRPLAAAAAPSAAAAAPPPPAGAAASTAMAPTNDLDEQAVNK